MLSAYSIENTSDIVGVDIQNYVVGLWFQWDGSKLSSYLPVPCKDLPFIKDADDDNVFLQTQDYYCADMGD